MSESTITDSPASETTRRQDLVSLPRWIVYFQGAFLGVVATTFFVFGMMVGSLTSESSETNGSVFVAEVKGVISVGQADAQVPDEGAVVLLLPENRRVAERISPASIHPESFEPLDNPVIQLVNSLGGSVVRADDSGKFNLQIDGPESFTLLVISRTKLKESPHPLTKRQKAELANIFRPVESLIGEHEFMFSRVVVDRPALELDPIRFD